MTQNILAITPRFTFIEIRLEQWNHLRTQAAETERKHLRNREFA